MPIAKQVSVAHNNANRVVNLSDADATSNALTLTPVQRVVEFDNTNATKQTVTLCDPSELIDTPVSIRFTKTSGDLDVAGHGMTTVALNGDGDIATFISNGVWWTNIGLET